MLKELQEQMKAQKEKLVAPLVESLQKIYSGFKISAALDDDGESIKVDVNTEGVVATRLSFEVGEKRTFSAESFEYLVKDGNIIGIKSHPVTIDFELVEYTFQMIAFTLGSIQESKEVKEEEAEVEIIEDSAAE